MRGGWNTELERRLRRADPGAGIRIEAAVVSNEHTKSDYAAWAAADSITGFDILTDGTVRLQGSLTTLIESTVTTALHADLNGGLQDLGASPWLAAQVKWQGTNPEDMEISRVRAKLDPQTATNTDVGYWVCELFNVTQVEDEDIISVVPIAAPCTVIVTANTAITEYTFDYTDHYQRPRPKMIRPVDPYNLYPDPTTWAVIRAITSAGTPATNVGWAFGTAVTSVTNGGSDELRGMTISAWEGVFRGKYGAVARSTPAIAFDYGALVTTTLSFTTASNMFDLGAAPTATNVEFVCEAIIPLGTAATFQIRSYVTMTPPEAGIGDWHTVVDGDDPVTLGVTNPTTRYWEGQIIVTPDAGLSVTPIIKAFGIREVTTTDLSDIAEVVNVSWAVDPVSLKGEIPECTIRAIRDGERDFNDAITALLSENYIGAIQFRLWAGAADLDRPLWLHLDDFLIDDYRCEAGHIEIDCLSPLALCKAVLPKYNTSTDELTALQYVTASSWTLKGAFEDLRNNQIELQGRFRGPSVEDDSTEVAKLINRRTEGKDELDAIAFLAGGCVTSKQGRVAFADLYGDKSPVAIFPSVEIKPSSVTPGYANRIPEITVEYEWSEDEQRYKSVIQRTHAAALANLGLARLEGPKRIDDTAAKWICATNCTAIAETVGQRWVDKFANGMVTLGFESEYAYPELELGDMVAVETDRFASIDPNTSNAVKGRLWVLGVIVRIEGALGNRFTIWVREYADIYSSVASGTANVGFRRYRSKVYNSTNRSIAYTTGASSLYYMATFDTEKYDEGDLHDTSTNTHQLLIPPGGQGHYEVAANVKYSGLNTGALISVGKNYAPMDAYTSKYLSISVDATSGGFVLLLNSDAEQGDIFVLNVVPEAGVGAVTLECGEEDETSLTITRLGA